MIPEKKSIHSAGILTLYKGNRNFGGLLQAYALQNVVSGFGIACEQISYTLSPTPIKQKLKNSTEQRTLWQNLIMVLQLLRKKAVAGTLSRYSKRQCRKRMQRFSEFEQEIPHSDMYNVRTVKDCGPYDAFITGSDQVWNGGIDLETFSLHFVNADTTCLSYAASYAGDSCSNWQKHILSESLNKFKAISVREQSLAEYLGRFVRKDISVVLDPVLLLDGKQWEEIMRPVPVAKPFVFCYLLGNTIWHRKFARKVSKDLHCELVTLPYAINGEFYFEDVNFGDIQDVSSGPKEFLWLIRHASCVVTDSFHAVAFSILFSKNFWALPRYQAMQKNRRILDILYAFDLQQRFIEKKEWKIAETKRTIDYSKPNQIIVVKRKESFEFLKTALGINNENQST